MGHVYEFKGLVDETIDLGAENYTDTSRWTDLTVAAVDRGLLSEPRQPDEVGRARDRPPDRDERPPREVRGVHRQRGRRRRRLGHGRRRGDGAAPVRGALDGRPRRAARSTAPAPCQAITARWSTNVVLASATRGDLRQRRHGGRRRHGHGGEPRRHRRDAARGSTSGDLALAIALAFNSLGWKSQNILFNLIDAILGEPLIPAAIGGEDPALVERDDHELDDHAGGDVTVSADGAALLNATVWNAADSTAVGAVQARRARRSAGSVAQNKVSSAARWRRSSGGDGRRRRRPSRVTARDEAGIYSNIKIVVVVDHDEQRRHGGAPGRDQQLPPAWTSSPATAAPDIEARRSRPDRRRPGDDRREEGRGLRVDGRGRRRGSLDARTTPTCGFWKPVPASNARPAGDQLHDSPTRSAIGGAIVAQRRPRATSTRDDRPARPSTPAASRSTAIEAATIVATTDVTRRLVGRLDVHRPGRVARGRRRDRDEPRAQRGGRARSTAATSTTTAATSPSARRTRR